MNRGRRSQVFPNFVRSAAGGTGFVLAAAKVLEQTLDEEGQTDKQLTQIAESSINVCLLYTS